jgi:hypothetical protein
MRVLPTTKLESIVEAWADMYDLDKEDYRWGTTPLSSVSHQSSSGPHSGR